VSLGGLLIALIPIATVLGAHFLVDGERFNPKSIPGLVVSLIGTGVLVGLGGGALEGVGNLWRGVWVSLVAVVLAGVGGALTRRFALEVGGDGLVIPQFAVATAVSLVAVPFLNTTPLSTIEPSGWALLVALGAVATAVPFSAFLIAAEVNPAARLGIAGYVVPVIAVVLGSESTVLDYLGEDGSALDEEGEEYFDDEGNLVDAHVRRWEQRYDLYVYAEHPDEALYLYQLAKQIMVSGRGEFQAAGLDEITYSGAELAPDPRYMPSEMFTRRF